MKQNRLPSRLGEFPRSYWILVLTGFIDNLGSSFLYPFFALYMTDKFNLSMVEVGGVFAVYAAANLAGSLLSGVLTDTIGRKGMILIGLTASAASSVFMGLVDQLTLFYVAVVLVGLFGSSSQPAQQVMIADLLPEEKHVEGYGIWRVSYNLALTVGPMLGGLVALKSFLWLFVLDAVFSLVTALIVFFAIPETYLKAETQSEEESNGAGFRGYLMILRDSLFMVYLLATIFIGLMDVQLSSSLPVFLRDVHNLDTAHYGYLMGFNAGLVVLFQILVSKVTSKYPKMLMMALGAGLYMLGFGMFGFVSGFPLFMLAMLIITLGEMTIDPIAQAIVIRFAPPEKRGRYIAVYESSWLIPYAAGPYLAGLLMDNVAPAWVWYAAGVLGLAAAAIYLWLSKNESLRTSTPEDEVQ